MMAVFLSGLACAGNHSSDTEVGSARDTTIDVITDSAKGNQTESGMTDSSGRSTLGVEAEEIRPDQGQPVTSKGDTVSASVDSATTAP